MSVPLPTPASRQGGRRFVIRAAAALLALLVGSPLLATVWSRRNLSVKVPRTGTVELENASYASREWTVSLKALEVKTPTRPVNGTVTAVWVLHYTNTDSEPHYVSVTVRCLDAKRQERNHFTAIATLQPDQPDGATFDIAAKMQESDWKVTTWAKVVVDFLSTPQG